MNYKNGREVKLGDVVIGKGDMLKGYTVGHVVQIQAAAPSPAPGHPPIPAAIKVQTVIPNPDHKDITKATFYSVGEWGKSENFVCAEDAFAAVPTVATAPAPAETLSEKAVAAPENEPAKNS